ncbi:putative glutamate synthase (NADPH) small subunit [Roseovarius litorisediminis]|uniref:Putative glutamate synthase (NADPH) small subunit n=1 Tax=Roseovarius litorisediminis TaxID=1312363 RepID=A0A1Y5TV43_9RHOB|nr:TIGR03862 family flavoprotein [Roseovarius litorisediminis]SLN69039.1 putative glutamate synthase (NADPH) small subunit [Roseovarius litorisediminis]
MKNALVIGAGPAGLMAAEELALAGHGVILAEAKPSVGRKFLMAGKSGLNLTKSEDFKVFLKAYGNASAALHPMLDAFGPDSVQEWAQNLGQELFTGSTGRVFPKVMKASPLLRNWLKKLDKLGVEIKPRWRWIGWDGNEVLFETPNGPQRLTPDVTVLACGGASWARLGSDGVWSKHLKKKDISPFKPANMGFLVEWSDHMKRHFGNPVKGVELRAGNLRSRGEFIISDKGLEGGGLYEVSQAMREGSPLFLDLAPDLNEGQVRARLSRPKGKLSISNYLRKSLKLDPAKQALLMEFAHPLPEDLTPLIKALPVRHQGARPLDEAISTAGGLRFDALDEGLMLRDRPGTFAAGEMLDWEAPTGGYLITACLATGRWAGRAAASYQGSATVR